MKRIQRTYKAHETYMNKSISRYMNTHICKYRQKVYIYIDVDIDIDKIHFFFVCVCVVVGMFELQSWGGFRAQLQKGLYRWLGFGFKGLGFRALRLYGGSVLLRALGLPASTGL